MSTVLLNAVVSVVTGLLVAVLGPFMVDLVRTLLNKPKLNKKGAFFIFVLLVPIVGFGLLNFVINPVSELVITKINGQSPAAATDAPKIGYNIRIEGYVTNPRRSIYVVVKPLNDRFWYVQPPAPVQFIESGRADWVGQAFLGTPKEGVGDTFDVFAVLSSERHGPGEKLSVEPSGLKSSSVLLKRTQ